MTLQRASEIRDREQRASNDRLGRTGHGNSFVTPGEMSKEFLYRMLNPLDAETREAYALLESDRQQKEREYRDRKHIMKQALRREIFGGS